MIGYVTVGTNDLTRAGAFYDQIFARLGAKRLAEMDRLISWSSEQGGAMFCVARPYNGEPATVGNGVMIALSAADPAQVEAVHALALSLGAVNEGDPGVRQGIFYCAYFRDMDGNKLNVFCMAPKG